jgi:hypothetical protein
MAENSKTPPSRETKPARPAPKTDEAAVAAGALDLVKGTVAALDAAAKLPMDGQAVKSKTDLTSELNNIDFKKMIGGPLQAAVDAQVASSLATVAFINQVGFTAAENGGKRELVMVDFSHTRNDVDAEGETVSKDIHIKVPLLAMLPIPSLRIEHVIVDFNAKLNSVESSSVSDDLKIGAEVGGGWGAVNFKVSASYQRKSTTNVEIKKEYSLNVNVKAVQDEIPAGLEKILGMLAA